MIEWYPKEVLDLQSAKLYDPLFHDIDTEGDQHNCKKQGRGIGWLSWRKKLRWETWNCT